MKKKEILPFEKGSCDCCLEENINVIICTSNNKCEYAMCGKCMSELRLITKTNKCPNCRETKIEIDLSDEEKELSEVEDLDNVEIQVDLDTLSRCERFGKGLKCICKWIYCFITVMIQSPYVVFVEYYDCIFDCYNIQSLRNNNTKKKIIGINLKIYLIQ